MTPEFGLGLASLFFGGASAAKTYSLQKKMYEFQQKVAEDKKREEAERVKKVSDVANIKEYQENLAEKLGVATQDLERLGLGGVRDIADTGAMDRTRAIQQYGEEFGPRGAEVEGYRDRLERDLIEAGGTEADITGMFTQPVQSASTGGGHAAWGNIYNDAMGSAARDIENYGIEGAADMATIGATRKADEQTYLMGKDLKLADTGETSMTDAFKTDVGLGKQSIAEQERKLRSKVGRAQAGIDRGYNVGQSVYVEPRQTNPYGAISNIFANASQMNWQQPYSYSGPKAFPMDSSLKYNSSGTAF